MTREDLKTGLKLTLLFRATVTLACVDNNMRKPVIREISHVERYDGGDISYIMFKGMTAKYRPSRGEKIYLYSISGQTREYTIQD